MPSSTFADARLTASGDLPDYTSFISGVDAVVQRFRFRVQLHKGEWFADPSLGLDWKGWLQRKPVPVGIIRAYVQATAKATPGIQSVRSCTASFDKESRTLTVVLVAQIHRSVVELEYAVASTEYGNVSPYITYRVLGPSAPVR